MMAYLADVCNVREELGPNHGKWVDDFLREAGGLGPGYPWCAASINWCAEACGAPNPDVSDAAVIGWKRWAQQTGRLMHEPARGRLCFYLHPDGTGHIGVVISAGGGEIRSIEGNTSSGNAGSQRDGDGLYRRVRQASAWQFFINLD
ncbi:MAG: CHAP domain-containing protein [Armatimonadetes bacterium]|nr:CHAP domain-containing protein [Armatimonadota bacterium]